MKATPPLQPYSRSRTPPGPRKPPRRPEATTSGPRALIILKGLLRWSWRLSAMSILLVVFAAGGALGGLKYSLDKQLPDISQLEYYAPTETTEILTADGKLLHKIFGEENRKLVPLNQVPDHVQKAVIAAEDARFYEHWGVDPIGLARALQVNFSQKETVQGGSTITQQVVKNMFLTPERTVQRKLAEMWMAYQVDQRYSKAQILELYLNQIYWGHNAYGIESAAQNYFGKATTQLSLAEGALLAGILTGPELYSPYHNPELAKQRQSLTLQRMVEVGFITPTQAQQANTEKLTYPGIKAQDMKHPYFTSYVLSILKHNYGESEVFQRGLRVYTTLNADWQLFGEKALREHIQKHKRARVSQGALVTIENNTGFVRAIVGGTGFEHSQFNRAWQAQRQPGSAFKPFVYLSAFSRGYKPEHLEVDEPIQYRYGSYVWKPKNYSGGHAGTMTLQRALESSNNIIAVKLGERVGNGNVIETAHRLGIRSSLRNVLSLALGPSEVTPLEMANAYSSIARGGLYLEPTPILWIEDRFGNIIEDNRRRYTERVASEEACGTLIQVMKGVIARGTAPEARIGRPAGGKTGTASDHKDAWFVGFTPQLTTAVWIGNDKPVPMYGYATGGHLSAPLWARFMRHAHRNLPSKDFQHGAGMLPILKGVSLQDPDADSGFMPQYEKLRSGQKKSSDQDISDPFLINPDELSQGIDNTVPMRLPNSASISGNTLAAPDLNAPQNLPTPPPPPPATKQNQDLVNDLDRLMQDLDRLELPVNENE
ncbi:MAG: PBP1A family penicillin-binding protein [Candidatus Sericytochromatia bacterium]|nr:PBP1A family penicillin-binding protein [Candidatus Sericytochromatia bacterium]